MKGKKRTGKAAGLPYILSGPQRDRTLFVLIHGWLQGWRFMGQCGMHKHVQVCYPRAPWLRANNWGPQHADQVADLCTIVAHEVGANAVVLGGLSDGTSPIHLAATVLLSLGRLRLRSLIHYSGLWPHDHVSNAKTLFVVGRDDRMPTAKITRRAAKAYGSPVFTVDGGHGWNSDANEFILAQIP
jgi:hypothetical protein